MFLCRELSWTQVRCIWMLHDTLHKGASCLELLEDSDTRTAREVAAQIEDAVWGQTGRFFVERQEHWPLETQPKLWRRVLKFYKDRVRKLVFNLGDTSRNPALCEAVLTGKLDPERLVVMSHHELFPELRAAYLWTQAAEALDSEDESNDTDIHGLFKCGKCRGDRTTYFQLQTRGADEPMTTYITCLDCGNHWKE